MVDTQAEKRGSSYSTDGDGSTARAYVHVSIVPIADIKQRELMHYARYHIA